MKLLTVHNYIIISLDFLIISLEVLRITTIDRVSNISARI
jgi:hypothetical protein